MDTVAIVWEADANGCVTADEFRASVAARLGYSPFVEGDATRNFRVSAQVRTAETATEPAVWVVDVGEGGASRRNVGTCKASYEAAALAVAVAIDPDAGTRPICVCRPCSEGSVCPPCVDPPHCYVPPLNLDGPPGAVPPLHFEGQKGEEAPRDPMHLASDRPLGVGRLFARDNWGASFSGGGGMTSGISPHASPTVGGSVGVAITDKPRAGSTATMALQFSYVATTQVTTPTGTAHVRGYDVRLRSSYFPLALGGLRFGGEAAFGIYEARGRGEHVYSPKTGSAVGGYAAVGPSILIPIRRQWEFSLSAVVGVPLRKTAVALTDEHNKFWVSAGVVGSVQGTLTFVLR